MCLCKVCDQSNNINFTMYSFSVSETFSFEYLYLVITIYGYETQLCRVHMIRHFYLVLSIMTSRINEPHDLPVAEPQTILL
jgi:hypothetical protein